jgi:hypothetical protein
MPTARIVPRHITAMAVGLRAAWVGGDDDGVAIVGVGLGLVDWRTEGADGAVAVPFGKEEDAAAAVDDSCPW